MKKQEQINKLIEETLESLEGVARAEAKPFLMTRIRARMFRHTESAWDRAGWFIGRPAVLLTGLCLILFINAVVVVFNRQPGKAAPIEQLSQSPNDEFSYTVATIYDIENTQP
ncbi:MAG TPA: hypothetical protein PKL81_07025 [Ferruginibacter sp.]|jgi:hypothetical protein|nr:hypothetical protein [Ferruginibacter sp.]MBN8698587.1 hypothetical protein [Chitinophagales bacterium]HMU71539.1 hypothetical protein [Ferruginibacter sp.]HMW27463.1 hypothetical protein [Ferruginibacter sp.]HMX36250.1 hypothetical protein [Ferruginibacter sp.]